MPREDTKLKYRCLEPCCSILVRSDKWIDHCRNKHAFRHARNLDIKYKTVEVKEGNGPWKPYVSISKPSTVTSCDDSVNRSVDNETVELIDFQLNGSTLLIDNPSDGNVNYVSGSGEIGYDMDLNLPVSEDVGANNAIEPACTYHDSERELISCDPKTSDNSLSIDTDVNDPAVYAKTRILKSTITLLVNSPYQPHEDVFFKKTNGRHFKSSWFKTTLPNGTSQRRHWLSYSKSTHAAYCLDCMLFGGPTADETWSREGYTGWISGHGTRGVDRHEESSGHKVAEIARFQWLNTKRIDKQLSGIQNVTIEQNRRVVTVAIKAIKYLAKEMMALRGHSSNEGKFLHLFKLLAEFDPHASAYLEKLEMIRNRENRNKPEVNLLSPLNTRRLLITMKDNIVRQISDTIKSQAAYSIICDGTQDRSKLEAEAVSVRYVECHEGRLRPVERLVDVFTTGETSGEVLCEKVVKVLDQAHLSLDTLVGQSYDGAGNVRGHVTGLRTRILEQAPKALYIWCHAHRLNLVIESMLECSTDIVGVIGLLQELYKFFGGHKRHAALIEMQKKEHFHNLKTLKRVSNTTRSWRSVEDAVETLIDCYDVVNMALDKLREECSDAATVNSASGLLSRLNDFTVVVSLFILRSIFRITGSISRMLQAVGTDLGICSNLLNGCIEQFMKIRSEADEHWQVLLSDAEAFAIEHDIQPVFAGKRVRTTKRMPGELARDEKVVEFSENFKVTVYIRAIDSILTQLQERFSEDTICFLKEMQLFTPASLSSRRNLSSNDIHRLCAYYDLDSSVVCRELNEFSMAYRQVQNVISLDDIAENSLNNDAERVCENEQFVDDFDEREVEISAVSADSEGIERKWTENGFIKPLRVITELSGFPTLTYLYKILNSLPVTSCSAERAMSRVRIIKNRLRSTMSDDWFSSLMVLSAERDLLDKIATDEIINNLALYSITLQKQLTYQ